MFQISQLMTIAQNIDILTQISHKMDDFENLKISIFSLSSETLNDSIWQNINPTICVKMGIIWLKISLFKLWARRKCFDKSNRELT